jgi:hypothetical protein
MCVDDPMIYIDDDDYTIPGPWNPFNPDDDKK